MIPAISEINFPSYATLSQATVSLQEMGDRTISTQIRIDGAVVPDFDGWELRFKGERFILPVKEPQAAKDNTSRRSVVDLTFQSWVVFQLQRYFFVSVSQIDAGTAIPDQYNASIILPIEGFVQLFNKVLAYYFGDQIRMDLFSAGTPGLYSQEPVVVEINKTHIWDVLVKFYELFGYRWRIEYDSVSGAHVIKVNYTAPAITDHDFEYGYQGGLLRFERQVQDTQISNVLIGRGGEKNLPYRYFKLQDPNNTSFPADPDAIPELANIYFDRLRDANFRWYVRGWMQNSHRDTSWDATHTFPTYTDADCPEPFLFAFHKGQTDEKFNPVEYVKDDDSIAKYGERWGAVDDNDEAYPTIQGRVVTGLGRVDEVVDVSQIVTDDIDAAAKAAATHLEIAGTKVVTNYFGANEEFEDEFQSEQFTVPQDQVGNVQYSLLNPYNGKTGEEYPTATVTMELLEIKAVNVSTGVETSPEGLQPGTYYLKYKFKGKNYTSIVQTYATYGFNSLQLVLSSMDADAWKPTFDIWVKNIWQSEQAVGESDEAYAQRVWGHILGDRAGNEAKVVFSTGFMSTSQDYEFVIAAYPVKDRSKTITSGGVNYDSEWKITLRKSDAEYEATGLYIPNATTGGAPAAGDMFYFIGIDMPFQYVVWGEEFLNGAVNTPVVNKTAALDKLAEINPNWLIQLDKVRCNTHEGAEYGQYLADRLSAGAAINIRDARFTGGEVLTLYVQTINYVWNEPTDDNPYLVPDIEVTLSDKVAATEGAVTRVSNELEVVKSTYARSADIEQVVRSVGNALFLKKTGESDQSASPTAFGSAVNSTNFRQGDFGGAGWGHYEDSEGNSILEVDTLVARKELRVNSLVANQIAYVGGKSIRSAASIKCTQVVEDDGYYYCYFDQKQGSVANLFLVGDFAMGQDFDENNAETRYYRMSVAGVGVDYIKLAKSGRDGQGVPRKGDTIVQYGHANNASRQYVIVEDVIGGGYQRMLSGLNTVSASGKEYYFAGRQPNVGERWFVGDAAGEHAEWKNGQLNITGRLSVRDINGNYQAMDTYMSGVSQSIANLQAQIDGQIQSWASGEAPTPQTEPLPKIDGGTVDPTTANFPASSWTNNTDREKHVGDIYVDDSTGQGYRYTKRNNNGTTEYYWTRITDEELAQALADIQALQQQYAGLVYLKSALKESTVIQGGLILSSLIQLGYTSGQTYNVMAGINGKPNELLSDQTRSIAAWFGGPMVDKDTIGSGSGSGSGDSYAKSLFRMDGSGYLAGGNIFWNKLGYGGIPGITWSRESGQDVVTIGGNVKLASVSGDTVTELLSLVQALSRMFIDVSYQSGSDTRHYIKVNPNYFDGIAAEGFGVFASSSAFVPGGGGGTDLASVWISLKTNTDQFANEKVHPGHLPLGAGLAVNQQTGLVDVTVQGVTRARDLDDADDLCYVDPDEGEEITIDDPGTTGTVLWGAESANVVALDVNGASKTLVKQAALDGINSAISNLATAVGAKQDYISDLSTIRSNASLGATAYGWGDHRQAGYITSVPTASASVLGLIRIGQGLAIDGNGVVSVTGQTQGTVTRVYVGSTAYNPDTDGYVTLPLYAFGAAGTDYVPITIGSTTKNVLTAHQSLSGYATETWVGQQGFITRAVNDLVNYYTKSQTYTQAEVNALIAAINQFHYEVYASTSAVTDPQPNVLYLIGPTGSGSDKYEEYVYPNATAGLVKIGDTSIDLTPYLTITSAQATYQPIISDLSTIRSRADEGHTVYGYFSNGVLGLAHIPLDDRLSYVDPEEGEDITIDDPGTTGTVLWGAESANNVALDVNGVSKTLVKQAALDGIYSSISSLSGLIRTKQDYISDLSTIRSNASLGATAYGWGDHRTYGYLTSVPTASASTLGLIRIGNGLSIDGSGIVSVTGQTQGTVTRVYVGSTAYNPDTNGYVTLPLYAFGTDGADYIPITIGSTTKNVLTAHQTLPTALKNPYKLTWGTNNEYDGSTAVTITAAQLGALTSHQTVTLASGTNNGTLKITTAAGTTDNVAVTGLGTAAYRGVASTIGASITNLVPGSLLYAVLGDAFDSSNTVKAFVNSSIATATATYRGNYNVVSDLGGHYNDSDATIASEIATKMASLSITPDDNDYCFVEIPTSDESGAPIAVTKRFKYNGTAWGYEYSLNNSGFTQAQWNALNSGITTALVAAFNAKYDKPSGGIPKTDLASAVQTSLGKADTALQPAFTGSSNIVTLGTITTGVWNGSAIAQDYLDDIGWVFVRNSATYDTEDYIHAN